MVILGIDTSLEACAVGVSTANKGAPIVHSEILGRGHAERLFGLVESALAEAGVEISDVERFAVTIGPGSFTGIRVGIAAARGFALVTGKPVYGFSTLAVHAASARRQAGDRPVLAALPAKGGDVFGQLFGSAGEEITEPDVDSPAAFAELAADQQAVLAGAGAAAIAEAPPAKLAIVHGESVPDIEVLLDLAGHEWRNSRPPRPLYIKPPDAKPTKPAVARQ